MALRQPGMAPLTTSLTVAGPPGESIPARILGRVNVAAGTSAVDFPTLSMYSAKPLARL